VCVYGPGLTSHSHQLDIPRSNPSISHSHDRPHCRILTPLFAFPHCKYLHYAAGNCFYPWVHILPQICHRYQGNLVLPTVGVLPVDLLRLTPGPLLARNPPYTFAVSCHFRCHVDLFSAAVLSISSYSSSFCCRCNPIPPLYFSMQFMLCNTCIRALLAKCSMGGGSFPHTELSRCSRVGHVINLRPASEGYIFLHLITDSLQRCGTLTIQESSPPAPGCLQHDLFSPHHVHLLSFPANTSIQFNTAAHGPS
jgi:hypothetical protein